MKHFLLSIIMAVSAATLFAQAPQALNYQGIARTNSGTPINSQTIKLRLSIQPANGTAWYVETHTVQTSQLGLYALQIGQGTVVNGTFGAIPWSSAAAFLQVEMDPAGGNNFTLVGVPTPLVSVPYALEANHAASAALNGDVTGSSAANTVTAIQNRPIAPVAPATGDVLKWNGSQWQPGADATSGGGAYSAGNGISISGNIISNNGDLSNTNEIQTLAINGPVLSLSNGGGSVTLPAGSGTYTEGPGIEINGNTISNAGDLDNTNELQSISLSGNTLTLSDGGGSVNLPSPNYNEGVGIEINGNMISNSGDLDNTNELQAISLSGNVLTLSDGGGSVTLPTGGGGFSLPYNGSGNNNNNTLFKITNNGGGGAIHGITYGGGEAAVVGEDPTGGNAGVRGYSSSSYGTLGYSDTGIGVLGQSSNGTGVEANSTFGTALFARSINGKAMEVIADNSPAAFFEGVTQPNGSVGAVDIKNTDLNQLALSLTGGLNIWGGQGISNFLGTITFDLTDGFTFCGNHVTPYVNSGVSLGSSAKRWSTVYAVNGTINTSDVTKKQAIQPIGYGLQQVMAMKPVSYEWKDNPEQGRKLGFLAQDLQKIVPEVVADKEWVGDEKGNKTVRPAEVLGVYYSDLIPVMAKAIQEQQAIIDTLKAENEALKAAQEAGFRKMEAEMAALKAAVLKAEK